MKTKYQAVKVHYRAGIYLAVTDGERFTVFIHHKRKWSEPLTDREVKLIGHATGDFITRERANLNDGLRILGETKQKEETQC